MGKIIEVNEKDTDADVEKRLERFFEKHGAGQWINGEVIVAAQNAIDNLLLSYRKEIDSAYTACDNDLTVALKVKLKPHRQGGIDLAVGISFTESKVSDEVKIQVGGQKQMSLFEKKMGRKEQEHEPGEPKNEG